MNYVKSNLIGTFKSIEINIQRFFIFFEGLNTNIKITYLFGKE